MKRFTIIAALFFAASLPVNLSAQQGNPQARKDIISKVIAEKKAYLKEKIPLSDKEAEAFFAVYDEMEMKKFDIAHSVFREAAKIRRSDEPVSNETYLKLAEAQAMIPVKVSDMEQEYFQKFKKILSPKQLFMYYQWEHRFGKDMIKREQKKVNSAK